MKDQNGDNGSLYKRVNKDFYRDQTKSKNPLRKWFHLNRYRIGNSLVKSKYEKGNKICDLGAGSCDWNHDSLNVFGIDVNQGLLEKAKKEKRLRDYKVTSAAQTGLPGGCFDIVTSFEFLEHVEDYNDVIKEANRLLKEGGSYIVSVPYDVLFSLWRPLFFLQIIFQGYILQNPYYKKRCGHINHFSLETIKKVLTDQGFSVDTAFVMRGFTVFISAHKGKIPAPQGAYDDVTVILPTYNEGKNIAGLLSRVIDHYGCDVIVSDDGSKDDTKANALGLGYNRLIFYDRGEKAVHGLTVSVLEAVELVKTKYFIVMDADGQHPPDKIRDVVNLMRTGSRLVVASRVEVEEEWSLLRRFISYAGTMVGKTSLLLRGKSYLAYDILSGFFGSHTRFWKKNAPYAAKKARFQLKGYKVLFDYLKAVPSKLNIDEVYYKFETRKAEVSKINLKIYLEYFKSCFLP